MSAAAASRGRVLSSQQVRFSDAPVKLGPALAKCTVTEASVSVKTDPVTGDILAIEVHCGCGEVTVVECSYSSDSDTLEDMQ